MHVHQKHAQNIWKNCSIYTVNVELGLVGGFFLFFFKTKCRKSHPSNIFKQLISPSIFLFVQTLMTERLHHTRSDLHVKIEKKKNTHKKPKNSLLIEILPQSEAVPHPA